MNIYIENVCDIKHSILAVFVCVLIALGLKIVFLISEVLPSFVISVIPLKSKFGLVGSRASKLFKPLLF